MNSEAYLLRSMSACTVALFAFVVCSVHPVIGATGCYSQPPGEEVKWSEKVCALMNAGNDYLAKARNFDFHDDYIHARENYMAARNSFSAAQLLLPNDSYIGSSIEDAQQNVDKIPLSQARDAFRNGDWQGAIAKYREIVASYRPSTKPAAIVQTIIQLAAAYSSNGDRAGAIDALKRGRELLAGTTGNDNLIYRVIGELGLAFMRNGKAFEDKQNWNLAADSFAESASYFQELARLPTPSDVNANDANDAVKSVSALRYNAQGLDFSSRRDFVSAIPLFAKARDLRPDVAVFASNVQIAQRGFDAQVQAQARAQAQAQAAQSRASERQTTSFLDVLNLGLKAYNAFQDGQNLGRAITGSGGGSYGGGGADPEFCRRVLAAAQMCRQNQQDMSSLGSSGGGTSGQAGAFNDCYNNYMNGFRAAQCR